MPLQNQRPRIGCRLQQQLRASGGRVCHTTDRLPANGADEGHADALEGCAGGRVELREIVLLDRERNRIGHESGDDVRPRNAHPDP